VILPLSRAKWLESADARLPRVSVIAPRIFSVKMVDVGSLGQGLSDPACLYRYPSPKGRSYHPNGRPPAFSRVGENGETLWTENNTLWQTVDCRRISAAPGRGSAASRAAMRGGLREPARWRRVPIGSDNNVRGTDTCFTGSSFLPRRSWAASRPADNHSASRPSSAPVVAPRHQPFSAVASAPAPSWAPRQTSRTATSFRAAATDAARAAVGPFPTDMTPATVATSRGGLFFGTTPAAPQIAGRERDR